jgi:hypothetical protein
MIGYEITDLSPISKKRLNGCEIDLTYERNTITKWDTTKLLFEAKNQPDLFKLKFKDASTGKVHIIQSDMIEIETYGNIENDDIYSGFAMILKDNNYQIKEPVYDYTNNCWTHK